MNPIRVVNVRGRAHDPDVVYIGRGSEWGNPYTHLPHLFGRPGIVIVGSREEAIERFRQDLWTKIKEQPRFVYELADLYGQTLGCYCAPLPCHGDVIAAAAEWAEGRVREIERDEG